MARMVQSGLVVDVDTDYQLGMPELQVEPDRAVTSDVGVSIDDVATTLNALVGGIRVGKYSTGGRRIDVRLKLLAGQRSRPEDIARLKGADEVGGPGAAVVSRQLYGASSFAGDYEERQGAGDIDIRERGAGHSQNEALKYVESLGKGLPVGNRLVLAGERGLPGVDEQPDIRAVHGIAIAYMILASQFNSYKDPFTIITILPLSIAGAAFALMLARQSLNIFQHDRTAAPDGIVKKNSIIPGGLCQCLQGQGVRRQGVDEAGGAGQAAADFDDGDGDVDGGHPAGARARAGVRDPDADGHSGYRGAVAVDDTEPGGRASFYVSRTRCSAEAAAGRGRGKGGNRP